MNWVNIITILIISLILIKILKHIIIKKLASTIIILTIIIVCFLLLSNTLSKSKIVQNNKFIQTGAIIVEDINKNIDKGFINNITKMINNIFKKLQNTN